VGGRGEEMGLLRVRVE
jgi:hypothetical protein